MHPCGLPHGRVWMRLGQVAGHTHGVKAAAYAHPGCAVKFKFTGLFSGAQLARCNLRCLALCPVMLMRRPAAVAVLLRVRGCPVVEVNLEATGNSRVCTLSIQGKAGELLPQLFSVQDNPKVAAALAAAPQAPSKRS